MNLEASPQGEDESLSSDRWQSRFVRILLTQLPINGTCARTEILVHGPSDWELEQQTSYITDLFSQSLMHGLLRVGLRF